VKKKGANSGQASLTIQVSDLLDQDPDQDLVLALAVEIPSSFQATMVAI